MKETINHPEHYGGDTPYEVIKVLEAWGITNFCLGNSIKYIARCGKKDSAPVLEDLKKARWYLDREITNRERAARNTAVPIDTPALIAARNFTQVDTE